MTQAPASARSTVRRHDREIVALAVPAFGALVAEPLFVMVDSAILGHLGTPHPAHLLLPPPLRPPRPRGPPGRPRRPPRRDPAGHGRHLAGPAARRRRHH